MKDISLTDFVDFVISSGTPKLTKVKNVKNRDDYHPAFDYWKILRDGIIEFHKTNSADKNTLNNLIRSVSGKGKMKNYLDRINKYKSFLGRKLFTWFNPPRNRWGRGNLQIRINPELGVSINGVQHVIKLYFKKDKLSKSKIKIILLLLKSALGDQVEPGTKFGILDVSNAKYYSEEADNSLLPLLIGEAESFKTIWDNLD